MRAIRAVEATSTSSSSDAIFAFSKLRARNYQAILIVIDENVQNIAIEIPCQIFNADESDLYFVSTPTNSYVDKDSADVPGKKVIKKRLIFMPCFNMDGSLK